MQLISFALLYTSALLLAALGGLFASRCGVFNIALEGIMVIGGLAGALVSRVLALPPALTVVCATLAAGAASALFALPLGLAACRSRADQIIAGTGLNLLAAAAALAVVRRVTGGAALDGNSAPFLWTLNEAGIESSVFLPVSLLALLVSALILNRTRLGLRLRACGDAPRAADCAGVSVAGTRMLGVLISGFLAGIGGLACIAPAATAWDAGQGMMGLGYLALAVLLIGGRKPLLLLLTAAALSLFPALTRYAGVSSTLQALGWPTDVYRMLPFIAALALLALTGKKRNAPKAQGVPFDKSMR